MEEARIQEINGIQCVVLESMNPDIRVPTLAGALRPDYRPKNMSELYRGITNPATRYKILGKIPDTKKAELAGKVRSGSGVYGAAYWP